MTVKELISALYYYPDDMDVFVAERLTEYKYGFVNSITSKKIRYLEEPDGETIEIKEVVIIHED